MPDIDTELHIDATPEEVWQVLSDLRGWREWNPLIPRIRGELRPGAIVRFRIRTGRATLPIAARMLRVEPAYELCWRGPPSRALGLLFSGEHYFRTLPDGEGTRFVHGEHFSGALSGAVMRRLGPALTQGYASMNRALKHRVERT